MGYDFSLHLISCAHCPDWVTSPPQITVPTMTRIGEQILHLSARRCLPIEIALFNEGGKKNSEHYAENRFVKCKSQESHDDNPFDPGRRAPWKNVDSPPRFGWLSHFQTSAEGRPNSHL